VIAIYILVRWSEEVVARRGVMMEGCQPLDNRAPTDMPRPAGYRRVTPRLVTHAHLNKPGHLARTDGTDTGHQVGDILTIIERDRPPSHPLALTNILLRQTLYHTLTQTLTTSITNNILSTPRGMASYHPPDLTPPPP